jgi:hypothetical protein
MTNPDRLTAIKARCERAQEGPWHFEDGLDKEKYGFRIYDAHQWGVCKPTSSSPNQREASAEFILHARMDLPWAMSRLEQLQEDVQRAADMLLGGYADRLKIQGLLQAALDRSKDSAALAQTAGKGEPSTTHLSQAEIDELNDCEG